MQVLGLRQRLEAAAGRGDMHEIVDDLNRAYDRGKLGADQAVLMNFIRDLARNMNAAGASGNRQAWCICSTLAIADVHHACTWPPFSAAGPGTEVVEYT